jgi:hypothetical protein
MMILWAGFFFLIWTRCGLRAAAKAESTTTTTITVHQQKKADLLNRLILYERMTVRTTLQHRALMWKLGQQAMVQPSMMELAYWPLADAYVLFWSRSANVPNA